MISTGNKSVRILIIYHPEFIKKTKVPVSLFYEEFSVLVERILVVPDEILICGDFNFKVNRSDNHEAITETQFLEYLNSLNLIQYVQEPTHILGNTLDIVITRNSSALIENLKVNTHMSDHMSILCDFHLKKPPVPK